MLHRDIKPQNIFLTADSQVRLGDFGISKTLNSSMSFASTFVGTPLYLSPELCEGVEYDSRSDVWSLGAVAFELASLQPPFTAKTMPALLLQIVGEEPPPLPAAFSAEFGALVRALLAKDPAKRPDLHDALVSAVLAPRVAWFKSAEFAAEQAAAAAAAQASSGSVHEGGGEVAERAQWLRGSERVNKNTTPALAAGEAAERVARREAERKRLEKAAVEKAAAERAVAEAVAPIKEEAAQQAARRAKERSAKRAAAEREVRVNRTSGLTAREKPVPSPPSRVVA